MRLSRVTDNNFPRPLASDLAFLTAQLGGGDFLKTCSKCKRDLPKSKFWRHHNKAGIYPSCIECELEARRIRLESNPLCVRCKEKPHMKGDAYCYECSRSVKRKGPPTHKKRKGGFEWCSKCNLRPRLPYHHMCHLCKMEYQNQMRTNEWVKTHPIGGPREISNARQYATGLLHRGKIRRGLCVFCGQPGTQFHHYDYEPRTRNFEDVCAPCHVLAHKFLHFLLTMRLVKV